MQNVIVTGGSRGLGLAMARTLAAGGYRIIALAPMFGHASSRSAVLAMPTSSNGGKRPR